MNRRQLLAGLGAAAAGSAAAVGTGAFTSVEADRTVSVEVADEETSSYLVLNALDPTNSQNGSFASNSGTGSAIELDFNDEIPDGVNNSGGEGVGKDSTYEFDEVFEVTNQGAEEIEVSISELTTSDFDYDNSSPSETLEVRFYPDSNVDSPLHSNPVTVSTGKSQTVGVEIKTGDIDLVAGAFDASATVNADIV